MGSTGTAGTETCVFHLRTNHWWNGWGASARASCHHRRPNILGLFVVIESRALPKIMNILNRYKTVHSVLPTKTIHSGDVPPNFGRWWMQAPISCLEQLICGRGAEANLGAGVFPRRASTKSNLATAPAGYEYHSIRRAHMERPGLASRTDMAVHACVWVWACGCKKTWSWFAAKAHSYTLKMLVPSILHVLSGAHRSFRELQGEAQHTRCCDMCYCSW